MSGVRVTACFTSALSLPIPSLSLLTDGGILEYILYRTVFRHIRYGVIVCGLLRDNSIPYLNQGKQARQGKEKKEKKTKGVCVGKKDLEGIEGGRAERKDWSKKEEKKRRLLERFHSIFRAALGDDGEIDRRVRSGFRDFLRG